jgi:putative endonuclease
LNEADQRRLHLERGRQAERFVSEELRRAGWTVLHENWFGGGGELDVVALRAGKLRFVEVRARAADTDVPVEETIGRAKRARLRGAAEAWLSASAIAFDEVAFLVALVDLDEVPWRVSWIDDAFGME